MSLLSPWFLAGALLIAGPIIFHLIRRATKDRIRFSATQFLKESPPQLQRKSRIQNPWLLLLRCAIIGLLAFAFGRPFIQSNLPITPALTTPNALVVIIDSSASMQRTGAWENAVEQVESYVDDLAATDQLSLISSAATARTLVTFEQWNEWPPNERKTLASATLAENEPTWGASRLDDAIGLALASLEQVDENRELRSDKRIVLISDTQKSARIAGIAGREWPEGCRFDIATVQGSQPGNTGIRWLGWSGSDESQRKMRIGVQTTGIIQNSERTLSLYDAQTGTLLGDPLQLYSNSGDNAIALLEVPAETEGPFKVELSGDNEPFDNTLYIAEERPRPMALHYYGDPENADDPNRSAFYIKRASAGWSDPVVTFGGPDMPDNAENRAPPFLLVDSPLDRATVQSVQDAVESGSHALVLLQSPDLIPTAQSLFQETGWSDARIDRADSRLGFIDFQHPSFVLFSDPRFSDFSRIRFWHTHALRLPSSSQASIVARYDDDSPAVLERTIGRGSVTLWVGDWGPKASQWTLSTKFVPWLQRLFERAAGGPDQPSVVRVDSARSLFPSTTARWQPIGASDSAAEVPNAPGLYRLTDGRADRWVALQIAPEESEWEPYALEDWERLGAPIDSPYDRQNEAAASESELRAQNAVELESQQQIWRWVILAVASLLILESLIARKLQTREDAVTA